MKTYLPWILFTLSLLFLILFLAFSNRYALTRTDGTIVYKLDRFTGKTDVIAGTQEFKIKKEKEFNEKENTTETRLDASIALDNLLKNYHRDYLAPHTKYFPLGGTPPSGYQEAQYIKVNHEFYIIPITLQKEIATLSEQAKKEFKRVNNFYTIKNGKTTYYIPAEDEMEEFFSAMKQDDLKVTRCLVSIPLKNPNPNVSPPSQ